MAITGTRDIGNVTVTVGLYDERDIGREEWPAGPWSSEDFDWAVWTDTTSGYQCAIKRNHSGAWCGYAVIPPEHPANNPSDEDPDWQGRDLTTGNPTWFDVHGGVTFHGQMGLAEVHLDGTAVGFDCSHAGDASPRYTWQGGVYRTAEYAVCETVSLASQIASFQPLEQLVSGTNAYEESQ